MTLATQSTDRIDPAGVEALVARSRRDVDEGLLPSCQLALAIDGAVVLDETFGAPAGSRYLTFSMTKAFTAAICWLLQGDGLLDPATRVADLIPSFAQNGKEAVTVEHLLTHMAGFPRAPMRPLEGDDRGRRVERFATWRLDWPAGSATEYHATSAWWVLAELIERVSGADFRAVFADRIAAPLGIPGLELGGTGPVLKLELAGSVKGDSERLGDRVAEVSEEHLLRFNDPAVRRVGVPGAGGIGTAADVALFYQDLLLNRHDVWSGEVLRDATGRVRNTFTDPLFGVSANRSLGVAIAGDDGHAAVRGFGRSVGPRSFGANGVGGQIAWADPDSGLSFCYLTNGLDVDVVGSFTRSAKIAGLAGRCVLPSAGAVRAI